MKTIFSLQTGIATLLCTAALAGLMACDADTVEQQGGKLPDKEPLETVSGMLRSGNSSEKTIDVLLTEGSDGFVMRNFYFQQTKPPPTVFRSTHGSTQPCSTITTLPMGSNEPCFRKRITNSPTVRCSTSRPRRSARR